MLVSFAFLHDMAFGEGAKYSQGCGNNWPIISLIFQALLMCFSQILIFSFEAISCTGATAKLTASYYQPWDHIRFSGSKLILVETCYQTNAQSALSGLLRLCVF